MTTITADVLRELHHIHQQLADLNDRIRRGPRQLAAGQNAVARIEAELATLKDQWKTMRMHSDEQQVQLKQREAKIVDLNRKLNECKTNTEFKMLKDQIAAEHKANEVLEDEILDKLERLDALRAAMKHAEEQLGKAHDELQKTQHRVEQEQATLQGELDRIHAALEVAEKDLPADFKAEYRRLVRGHGPDGLAPVEGETCGNCNTVLTPQTMNELYMSRIVFCKSCGCVLYLAEDRARA